MPEYASIKSLWWQSLLVLKNCWQPLLVGACFFGSAMAVLTHKTVLIIQTAMAEAMASAGIQNDMFSGLLDQAKNASDTEALLEVLSAQQQAMSTLDPIAAMGALQEQALIAISALLPIIAIAVMIGSFIVYCAMQYYFVMAVKRRTSVMALLYDMIRYVVPMFCLSAWVSIRSFIWVPFIGVFIGLIYTPRFSVSGVLLVSENTGIFTSATQSFHLTRGLWYKIVHHTYVTTLIASLVYYGVIFAVRYFDVSAINGAILRALVAQILLAYVMVFVVELSQDIIATKRKIEKYESEI